MNREKILDTAKEYVTRDRQADHGEMENNFATIAKYWSIHLGFDVSSVDVGVMMGLLKLARIKSNRSNEDNYIDCAGYLACAGECSDKG